MHSILENIQVRSCLDYVSGTADRTGAIVDTSNIEGVVAIVKFATIATGGTNSIKWQQGDASDLSDAADLAGTAMTVAADDDNQIFVTELRRPNKRYVRLYVDKDTTNACAESVVYLVWGRTPLPITQTVTDAVTYERHVSPAEGTA